MFDVGIFRWIPILTSTSVKFSFLTYPLDWIGCYEMIISRKHKQDAGNKGESRCNALSGVARVHGGCLNVEEEDMHSSGQVCGGVYVLEGDQDERHYTLSRYVYAARENTKQGPNGHSSQHYLLTNPRRPFRVSKARKVKNERLIDTDA